MQPGLLMILLDLRNIKKATKRSGRVVDCTGLENRRSFTGSGGSNPPSSAEKKACLTAGFFCLMNLVETRRDENEALAWGSKSGGARA